MPIRQGMEIWSISTLRVYADDIVIIGNTRQEVETKIYNLINAVKPMGLKRTK